MFDPKPITTEEQLRRRLGVPDDAHKILVLGESSHMDPNWLWTSEEYYRMRIPAIMEAVFAELDREPRRIFSIESLFFLRLFWEREPRHRSTIERLLHAGRLRLTGTGITTPDTLLPSTEAILRDFQLGQQWLRDQGLRAEPRVAYLPDDFGYSPATPALLRALGFDFAGITRIDGMYFVSTDFRPKSAFPLPDSSAALLQKDLKTLDFVWRAPDGSEVLCHWNAFTYFQGDMLAHKGIIRWMGRVYGTSCRTRAHVARRIQGFVEQLAPLSRTPYMFCPVGCDFNDPISGLVELLDRYNRERYPDTGVWAVNAGLDDYLELVDAHRGDLPVVELDPNPYWMGFYASRPEAKSGCNRIVSRLIQAEKLATASSCTHPDWERDIREAWDLVAISNHHDLITGTSPDRVWEAEQKPWLERAERLASRVLSLHREACPVPEPAARPAPPTWRLANGRLEVACEHYRVVMSERAGGCLVSYRPGPDGEEMLSGPANDLIAYRDSGGLWRFGHEFRGGKYRERDRSSRSLAHIEARERDGLLEVRVSSSLEHRPFTRWLWFRADSPIVRMRVAGAASRRISVACRFPTRLRAERLRMDVPGGHAERPLHKLFDPTYWAVRTYTHIRSPDGGLAAFLGGPGCAGLVAPGVLEWVVLRNVPREMAWGLLPILAHPAGGTDPGEHLVDYAAWFIPPDEGEDLRLAHTARRVLGSAWLRPGEPDYERLADSLFVVDRDDVMVSAVKAADHGDGFIVRLLNYGDPVAETRLRWTRGEVSEAWLCDARERDQEKLGLEEGRVVVPLRGVITSVRLQGRGVC